MLLARAGSVGRIGDGKLRGTREGTIFANRNGEG